MYMLTEQLLSFNCTKLKKEILNCTDKYRVLRTYWTPLVYNYEDLRLIVAKDSVGKQQSTQYYSIQRFSWWTINSILQYPKIQ